jgi:hypothetical protein
MVVAEDEEDRGLGAELRQRACLSSTHSNGSDLVHCIRVSWVEATITRMRSGVRFSRSHHPAGLRTWAHMAVSTLIRSHAAPPPSQAPIFRLH